MKNIILSALTCGALCLATSQIYARPFSGPYAGVGVGYGQLTLEHKLDQVDLNLNNQSIKGNVFAGFGYLFEDVFYLGIEPYFSSGTTTEGNEKLDGGGTGSYVTEFTSKQKYSYGIDLLPGLRVNRHALIFVKGGYTRSRFTTTIENEPPGDDVTHTNNHNVNGYRLGIGAEIAPEDTNIRLRVEFNHDRYQEYTATFTNGVESLGIKTQPTVNSIMLNALYQFSIMD
jgi:opacity protein-like surface antigen